MTKLQKATKDAIKAWCRKNKIKDVKSIRHIFPRAYILAKPAPACIVIATPWQDAEKHMRDYKYSSWNIIRNFDESLKVGDWCSVCYISRPGIQTNYAIPCVEV